MSFLGVRSFSEQKIYDDNVKLLNTYIPFDYHGDFMRSIGMKKLHERQITIDEINIYISQHPSIRQASEKVQEYQQEVKIKQVKREEKLLFTDLDTEESIKKDIKKNMKNLAGHEGGTSWMKWGAMLSGNSADQITAAGFKALIEQNKILIRQNELIRRQNENIIELLSKKDEE